MNVVVEVVVEEMKKCTPSHIASKKKKPFILSDRPAPFRVPTCLIHTAQCTTSGHLPVMAQGCGGAACRKA